MRPLDLQTIEDAADVVARTLLGIAVPVFRHIGGRIAARVVPDAAIQACEVAQLRLPAAQVAAEFVHEDERRAGARLLVLQADAVVSGDGRHVAFYVHESRALQAVRAAGVANDRGAAVAHTGG